MVIGYANNSFIELMDWLYVLYGQITPGYLMRNQDKIQAENNIEQPIETRFDHMETVQEFEIARNSLFSDCQMADMGVAKILATQ